MVHIHPLVPYMSCLNQNSKALQTYLNENLEKGFIQPSNTQVQAPILFFKFLPRLPTRSLPSIPDFSTPTFSFETHGVVNKRGIRNWEDTRTLVCINANFNMWSLCKRYLSHIRRSYLRISQTLNQYSWGGSWFPPTIPTKESSHSWNLAVEGG